MHDHDIVALAASASHKSKTQALKDAQRIGKASKGAQATASRWAVAALTPVVKYIQTVGANNPPAKVAKRADVKTAVQHAAKFSHSKVLPLLDDMWEAGRLLGMSAARKQAKIHDLPKPKNVAIPDTVLKQLKADLERIRAETPDLLLNAYVAQGTEGLEAALKLIAFRTGLVLDAATKHAAQAALEASLKSPETQKMWLTQSSVPCSHCKALHGMILDWDEAFPEKISGAPRLKVYDKGGLQRPPRHPHCMCVVVAVPKT